MCSNCRISFHDGVCPGCGAADEPLVVPEHKHEGDERKQANKTEKAAEGTAESDHDGGVVRETQTEFPFFKKPEGNSEHRSF